MVNHGHVAIMLGVMHVRGAQIRSAELASRRNLLTHMPLGEAEAKQMLRYVTRQI